jgi:hypothetical protein
MIFFNTFELQVALAILHGLFTVSGFVAASAINGGVAALSLHNASRTYYLDPEEVWNPSVFYMIAAFSLVTTIAHVFYAYNHATRASLTWRWFEYSISAPIMFVIIDILSGVSEVIALSALFGLIQVTMFFGYYGDLLFLVIDPVVTAQAKLYPLLLGTVPFTLAWILLSLQFGRAVIDVRNDVSAEEEIPWFVYVILPLMFILFSSFALVQYYYIFRTDTTIKYNQLTKPKDGVRRYIQENDPYYTDAANGSPTSKYRALLDNYDLRMHYLSLLAKAGLTWLVIGGIASLNVPDETSTSSMPSSTP